LKISFEGIESFAIRCLESVRTTRLIRDLSALFWKILRIVSGIQISVDFLVEESRSVRSRNAVYLIALFLLTLIAIMFPDKIPSILSSLGFDNTAVLERTQGLVRAIRRLLPAL